MTKSTIVATIDTKAIDEAIEHLEKLVSTLKEAKSLADEVASTVSNVTLDVNVN